MPKKVSLSREDRSRMDRLFEEVRTKLHEIALIGTRVMTRDDPEFAKLVKQGTPVLQFTPRAKPRSALALEGTEFICYGSGEGMCLCYDYDAGVCEVC